MSDGDAMVCGYCRVEFEEGDTVLVDLGIIYHSICWELMGVVSVAAEEISREENDG